MAVLVALDDPGHFMHRYHPDPGDHWHDAQRIMQENGSDTARIVYWDALAREYRAKTFTKQKNGNITIDFQILGRAGNI